MYLVIGITAEKLLTSFENRKEGVNFNSLRFDDMCPAILGPLVQIYLVRFDLLLRDGIILRIARGERKAKHQTDKVRASARLHIVVSH